MSAAPSPSTAGPTGPSRRRLVAAVVAVLAVVAVVVVVKLATGGSPSVPAAGSTTSPSPGLSSRSASATPGPSASASPTTPTPSPTPTPTTSATPAPSVTTPETPKVLQTHKPVPAKSAAPFGDGVTARITSLVPTTSVASGVGEISGPAAKVTLQIENGTKNSINLNQVTVILEYTKQHTPSIPITSDPSNKPFTGSLDPGAKASGSYIFQFPKSGRSYVTITVSYAALSPIVAFTGAVK